VKNPIRLYGIPNCDTMKRRAPGSSHNDLAHEFHDYKKSGIERGMLETWIASVGWEVLLNRAGSTFRKLSDSAKANLTEAKAVKLMLAQPSMIKRPVLERGKTLMVGFSPEKYSALK
jgi:arsenate reductase